MIVTGGDSRSRRAWRRSRLLHLSTTAVGLVSWLAGIAAALLWGGSPSAGALTEDAGLNRNGRRNDARAAQLLLRRTIGWPRDWQVDLSGSFAVRWRGGGAFIGGVLSVGLVSVRWEPSETWTEFGARGFELRLDSIKELDVTRFSRRSVGLIVRGRDEVEVWFLLRGRDSARLVAELQAPPHG
jgi:hypothetical protein